MNQHTTDEYEKGPTCPVLGPVEPDPVVPLLSRQLFVWAIEHHVAAFVAVENEQEKIGGGGNAPAVIEIVSTEMSPVYEDPLMLVKTT
jgi:hypothetical protein